MYGRKRKHSEDTKKRMSMLHKGRFFSEETKKIFRLLKKEWKKLC